MWSQQIIETFTSVAESVISQSRILSGISIIVFLFCVNLWVSLVTFLKGPIRKQNKTLFNIFDLRNDNGIDVEELELMVILYKTNHLVVL